MSKGVSIPIDEAESNAFRITMKNGDIFTGFILRTEGTLIAALLYSRIINDEAVRLNDTEWGTEWRILVKSQVDNIAIINGD